MDKQTLLKGKTVIRPKGFENIEIGLETSESGWFSAVGFSGKRNKPDFHYRFKTIELRDKYLKRYLDDKNTQQTAKAKRKQESILTTNPVNVGDIFYSSWGYDQTNVDFYQVIAVKNKFIVIKEIEQQRTSTGYDTGYTMPVKNAFLPNCKILTKKVCTYNGGKSVFVRLNSYSNANIWDGTEKRWSSYA